MSGKNFLAGILEAIGKITGTAGTTMFETDQQNRLMTPAEKNFRQIKKIRDSYPIGPDEKAPTASGDIESLMQLNYPNPYGYKEISGGAGLAPNPKPETPKDPNYQMQRDLAVGKGLAWEQWINTPPEKRTGKMAPQRPTTEEWNIYQSRKL